MSALQHPTIATTAPTGTVHAADWDGSYWLRVPVYSRTLCKVAIRHDQPWRDLGQDTAKVTCRRCRDRLTVRKVAEEARAEADARHQQLHGHPRELCTCSDGQA